MSRSCELVQEYARKRQAQIERAKAIRVSRQQAADRSGTPQKVHVDGVAAAGVHGAVEDYRPPSLMQRPPLGTAAGESRGNQGTDPHSPGPSNSTTLAMPCSTPPLDLSPSPGTGSPSQHGTGTGGVAHLENPPAKLAPGDYATGHAEAALCAPDNRSFNSAISGASGLGAAQEMAVRSPGDAALAVATYADPRGLRETPPHVGLHADNGRLPTGRSQSPWGEPSPGGAGSVSAGDFPRRFSGSLTQEFLVSGTSTSSGTWPIFLWGKGDLLLLVTVRSPSMIL